MEAAGTEVTENTTPKDSIAATPEEVEGLASGKFIKPAFRGKERRASVALYISKTPSTRTDAPTPVEGEIVELPISSHSRPAQVAGALAARIRDGANASLVAIGVDAVANAVLTIGNARLYLEQNNLDIRAAPEFITVQKEERELNAV
ncbi:hypothetical protein QJQ45_008111 [Haematococcus lacustris]|nr:hypothetical protein QJQ45_008111 [Haematococcus lacustris]